MALNYLLITILAYFAALAANDILVARSRSDGFVVHSVSRAVEPAPSHSRSDYQAIVDRDIFNLTPAGRRRAAAGDRRSSSDPHRGIANEQRPTLRDNRGPARCAGGLSGRRDDSRFWKIDRPVEKDRAVVEHDGQNVVIQLPKDELTSAPGLQAILQERSVKSRSLIKGASPINQSILLPIPARSRTQTDGDKRCRRTPARIRSVSNADALFGSHRDS